MENKKKLLIIAGLGLYALASTLFFIWYFENKDSGSSSPEQISETTNATEAESGTGQFFLKISDNGTGTADVILESEEELAIAGAEVYLYVEGELEIEDITCTETFSCIESGLEDQTVTIIALRPLNLVESPLQKSTKIATINYDTATSGSLTVNDTRTEPLLVSGIGSGTNLADSETRSFNVGM